MTTTTTIGVPAPSGLALTGSYTALDLTLAVALVALGAGLVRRSRK